MGRQLTRLTAGDKPHVMAGDGFVIDLDWEFPDDLDLAGLCVNGDGAELVYYGRLGRRHDPPFMHLAHESDGSARSKHRREHLVVTRASAHERIYLFVWDHEATREGHVAAFAQAPESYELTITDRTNARVHLDRPCGSPDNCILLGCLQGNRIVAEDRGVLISDSSRHIAELLSLAGTDAEVVSWD